MLGTGRNSECLLLLWRWLGEHRNVNDGNVRHVPSRGKCRLQLENEGEGEAGKHTVTSATYHNVEFHGVLFYCLH